MKRIVLIACLLAVGPLAAQVPREFDACQFYTQEEADKLLGGTAKLEVVKSRSKMIPGCTYTASVDGKALSSNVLFRFGRNPAETLESFKEARLAQRGKSTIISGLDAFWSEKQGQLNLVKGSTWIIITSGPARPNERQIEHAKRIASLVLAKM